MISNAPLPPPPAIDDRCALFLDVDGTLLDFAPHPDAIRVPDGLHEVLMALHRRLDGAVALVSGRPVEGLDALFHPLQLPAAGLHGLELRSGEDGTRAPPRPDALAGVLDRARTFAAQRPGTVVEDKGSAVALHWRAAPEHAGEMQALAREVLEQLPGYRLQHGNHVAELRPDGADKGDAIAALAAEPPFRGRTLVFAGDDLTDEHGFELVNERGGTSVLVGDRTPSAARHALRDTAAVLEWLRQGARA